MNILQKIRQWFWATYDERVTAGYEWAKDELNNPEGLNYAEIDAISDGAIEYTAFDEGARKALREYDATSPVQWG